MVGERDNWDCSGFDHDLIVYVASDIIKVLGLLGVPGVEETGLGP